MGFPLLLLIRELHFLTELDVGLVLEEESASLQREAPQNSIVGL